MTLAEDRLSLPAMHAVALNRVFKIHKTLTRVNIPAHGCQRRHKLVNFEYTVQYDSTRTGMLLFEVVPSPSLPSVLLPQHQALPLPSTAQV